MKTATAQSYRVLLADDQSDIRDSLRLLLKGEGYETQGVASPAEALNALEAREFDAVLMDLNYARDTTSGQEGLDLLTRIQVIDSTVPVVVMTAWSSIELAVEAMRRGARDFIAKPWENNRLLSILRTQIDLRQALRQASRLEAENRLLRAESRPTFLANSPAMASVLELIAQIGPSDANVLITGEHGTGKEVVARTLHALSPRATKPMVTVNAGGLSEGVFESELFGHVKGAFTDARSGNRRPRARRLLDHAPCERESSGRDQRRRQRRGRCRPLSSRPSLPAEYHRDSLASASRTARRHRSPCPPLPSGLRATLPQEHRFL